MSKGTPAMGHRQHKTHIACRRCGHVSFNSKTKMCASCGFGKTKRMRSYKWQEKSGY